MHISHQCCIEVAGLSEKGVSENITTIVCPESPLPNGFAESPVQGRMVHFSKHPSHGFFLEGLRFCFGFGAPSVVCFGGRRVYWRGSLYSMMFWGREILFVESKAVVLSGELVWKIKILEIKNGDTNIRNREK